MPASISRADVALVGAKLRAGGRPTMVVNQGDEPHEFRDRMILMQRAPSGGRVRSKLVGRKLGYLAGLLFGTIASASNSHAEQIDRGQIQTIIREYILENPQIIEEALTQLQLRAQKAEAEAKSAALLAERSALLESKGDIVMGNPNGDVSLVEFFDFNCGYCKRAAPDVAALVAGDPKLRVVLKDLPVLGPGSVEAAKVGLAVKQVAGETTAGEFHKRLMDSRGRIDGSRALQVAGKLGIDTQRLKSVAATKEIEVQIYTNLDLAQRLGVTGTPSFVVGNQLMVGAVGQKPLEEAIRATRK